MNISSTFGHKPGAGLSHYAASKAALEHLTRCWALELAPLGERVNAVAGKSTFDGNSNAITAIIKSCHMSFGIVYPVSIHNRINRRL